ncbi:MAG TPA: molybdenum cofactor biosynthesis protein MoaE [Bacteroidota bacterium]|nr:molybdenum cofactor biosynthesis protein MoaE [Bacteroidota bacterium]
MTAITERPIEVSSVLREIASAATGGIDLFIGTVRDTNDGKSVGSIEYSAYVPMAEEELRRIESEIRERWPVENVALVHRIGLLRVGEISVLTVVGAPHRAAAFEACRYAIERVKADVPIWKKEFAPDPG